MTPASRRLAADIYGLDRDLLNILHGDRRISDIPVARNYNSSSKPVMSAAAEHAAQQAIPLCQQSRLHDLGIGGSDWSSSQHWARGPQRFSTADRTASGSAVVR